MNEQNYSTPFVAGGTRRDSRLPATLAVILLLLLLPLAFLFSRWLLDTCIAAIPTPTAVLGITNLAVDAEVDQTEGGEVVMFNVLGDNTGPLSNGTVTFNTIGSGRIQSAPTGSGLCVVTSETQATCTNVNLLDNEQLAFVVPVLADAVCGLMGDDSVGLAVDVDDITTQDVQDATASGNVDCVAATTTSSSSSSSSSSSGGATTTTDDSSSTTTSSSSDSAALAACYTYANNGLLLAIGLILLLILIIYLISTWATRRGY
jgi:hypothetical protein